MMRGWLSFVRRAKIIAADGLRFEHFGIHAMKEKL